MTRAPESIVFGLKSPEKPPKSSKKLVQICSGTGGREFESRHFDQKEERVQRTLSYFCPWRIDSHSYCEQSEAGSSALISQASASSSLVSRARNYFAARQSPRPTYWRVLLNGLSLLFARGGLTLTRNAPPPRTKSTCGGEFLQISYIPFHHIYQFLTFLQPQVAIFTKISPKPIDI